MAFNRKNDLQLGEGLMLYVTSDSELLPVAYATSHSLSVNGETIDTSSKMSGAWQDFLIGQLNWQLTSDSLVSKTAGHMSFNTLFDLMVAREGIPITVGTPLNTETFELDTAKPILEGEAAITSLEQTASNGEVCTSSATLQGLGELKRVNSTP
jgi:hypothetical protein